VFALRVDWATRFPGSRKTDKTLAQDCGVSDRVIRLHTAHLIRHRKLTADGLPVAGVAVADGGELPPDADPLQWAGCQRGLTAGGRELLVAYAWHGWAGRVPLADLAKRARMAERTAKRHRAALVGRELLEIRRQSHTPEWSDRPIRLPDAYRLMAGRDALSPRLGHFNEEAEAQAVADARKLVDGLWWFGESPAQLTRAYALVARLTLEWGWPVAVLAPKVAEPFAFPVQSPMGMLRKMLPNEGETYRPSAREVSRGEIDAPAVPLIECPHCGSPGRPGPRMDLHISTTCPALRTAAPDVPVTPAMRAYVGSLAVPA